jgi:hypothetical protein
VNAVEQFLLASPCMRHVEAIPSRGIGCN